MLVLTRKENERVVINGPVEIVITKIKGDRVQLGFIGPTTTKITRKELLNVKSK